jgi:hypothetical protein
MLRGNQPGVLPIVGDDAGNPIRGDRNPGKPQPCRQIPREIGRANRNVVTLPPWRSRLSHGQTGPRKEGVADAPDQMNQHSQGQRDQFRIHGPI